MTVLRYFDLKTDYMTYSSMGQAWGIHIEASPKYFPRIIPIWAQNRTQQGKGCFWRRSEPLPGPKGPGTSKKGALSSNRYNIGQALRDTLSMLAPTCGWLGVGYIANLGVLEPVYSLRAIDLIM